MPGTVTSRQSGIAAAMAFRSAGRDPAIPLAPKHQMRMPDLRHAPRQFAALTLQVQVHGRSEPDALGNTERLLQEALVESLQFAEAFAKPRHHVWRKTIRNEQRAAAVAITARVISRLVIIRRNRPIWSRVERHAERRDRIEGEHPAKAFGLLEQHRAPR